MTSVENMRFQKSFFQNIYRSGYIDKRIQALFVNDEREAENKKKCLSTTYCKASFNRICFLIAQLK